MTLLWDGSFHSSDHWVSQNGQFGNWIYSCLKRPDSSVVVPNIGGRNDYVGEFNIQRGDQCNSADINSDRAVVENYQLQAISENEYWYGFSTFIPNSGMKSTEMIFQLQWKDLYQGSNPGGALWWFEGHKQFWINGQNGWGFSNTDVGGLIENSWVDWLINVKWSKTGTGFFKLYKNGVPILERYNLINMPPTSTGSIGLMEGLYTTPYDQNTIYIGWTKVGTTRSDVEYTGINPPPTCPQATLNMVI